MKYAKRILCMLLVLVMLLPAVVACNKGTDAEDTEPEAVTPEDTASGIPEGALSKDDIAKLVIIRSADASETVVEAINELKKDFKAIFGVTTKILTDKNSSDEGAIELIIGQTTRKQSKNALKKLKGFGYVIGNFDGAVVINSV